MTATWKTFCQDSRGGWIAELTLSAEDLAALLDQVNQAQDQLQKRGYLPCDPYAAPTAARVAANLRGQLPLTPDGAGGDLERVCSVHGVKMTHFDKDGRSWFAHRTAEGAWCSGNGARAKAGAAAGGLFGD